MSNEETKPMGSIWYADLTKREFFAAMAMQGLVSSVTMSRDEVTKFICESAVKYADALIAELEKE